MRKQKTMIDVWDKLSNEEKDAIVKAFIWLETPMSLGQLALTKIRTVEKMLGHTPSVMFGGMLLYNK